MYLKLADKLFKDIWLHFEMHVFLSFMCSLCLASVSISAKKTLKRKLEALKMIITKKRIALPGSK